jgi:hypothetical protein
MDTALTGHSADAAFPAAVLVGSLSTTEMFLAVYILAETLAD